MEQWLPFPSEPFSCPTIWILVYCLPVHLLNGSVAVEVEILLPSLMLPTAHCPLVHSLVLSPSHPEGV